MKLQFAQQILKKSSNVQLLRKSVQWEPSFSTGTRNQTDGQTDVTKLLVALQNFAKAPKMVKTNNLV
jgi:hypothetical protein